MLASSISALSAAARDRIIDPAFHIRASAGRERFVPTFRDNRRAISSESSWWMLFVLHDAAF
jgi:hypothetical protein